MQEIGKLRKLLRTWENFLEAVQRNNHALFPTSSSVQQVSLGPVIALDGLDQTMKDVGLLADTVVSEWVKDMHELQGVADSYLGPVTLAAKTDLLQPPQAELLKLLCEEGKVKKLTNGASLMGDGAVGYGLCLAMGAAESRRLRPSNIGPTRFGTCLNVRRCPTLRARSPSTCLTSPTSLLARGRRRSS